MLNYQRVPFGTQLKHGTKWVISHSKLFDNQSDTPRIFASRVGRGVRPGHRFCFFCALATTVPFGTDEKWVKHMEFVWNWGIQKQFFHWTWWRKHAILGHGRKATCWWHFRTPLFVWALVYLRWSILVNKSFRATSSWTGLLSLRSRPAQRGWTKKAPRAMRRWPFKAFLSMWRRRTFS